MLCVHPREMGYAGRAFLIISASFLIWQAKKMGYADRTSARRTR
jgi:hypothetical protein